MKLKKIVEYLDTLFDIRNCQDISQNGLQVESGENVQRIVIAVDACMDTFKEAKRLKAQLLIVHHGLFWGKSLLVTGVHRERIAYLLENNISLYGMHLPLDTHSELGNNAQLAKLLNAKVTKLFGKGIGCEVKLTKAEQRDSVVEKVLSVLDTKTYRLLDFGPKKISRIAILSGSGSSFIPETARKNIDLLITGEGGHVSYHMAKEEHVNVLYAGHYATETLGVKALACHLEQKFNIPYDFIHIPTDF